MTYTALGRGLAVALATLVLFGIVFLREATSPSGSGYWTAMAAAPGIGLYLADESRRELRLLHPGGAAVRVATTPPGIYRALAADGPHLLLATEGKLYRSEDAGRTWKAVLSGRFTAVAVGGGYELAGAWAQGLYMSDDFGADWSKATLPEGDTEFLALSARGFAGTLLGLLGTRDGHTWTHVPGVPDRITALDDLGGETILRAGDWRGQVWLYDYSTGAVSRSATFRGGIEGMADAVTGTTAGIYPDHGGPLHGREVTRVVSIGINGYYASVAGGAIYFSPDGYRWTFAYQA